MKDFDSSTMEAYKKEAQQRWGKTDAYTEYEEKTKHRSENQQNDAFSGMNDRMAEFALCMKAGSTPESAQAQTLVRALQAYITENFYSCTNEILLDLGRMYVRDERFRENIDKNGDGTAAFICAAICHYCQ